MATSGDSSSSAATLKENVKPISSRINELNESRTELLNRIQGLKQDVQNWRSKLDTQVTIYRNELSELKKSLNEEVVQLQSEFKDLRTTLQQQQDDVTSSLKDLKLQGATKDAPISQNKETDQSNAKVDDGSEDFAEGSDAKEGKPEESEIERS